MYLSVNQSMTRPLPALAEIHQEGQTMAAASDAATDRVHFVPQPAASSVSLQCGFGSCFSMVCSTLLAGHFISSFFARAGAVAYACRNVVRWMPNAKR